MNHNRWQVWNKLFQILCDLDLIVYTAPPTGTTAAAEGDANRNSGKGRSSDQVNSSQENEEEVAYARPMLVSQYTLLNKTYSLHSQSARTVFWMHLRRLVMNRI